MDKALGTIECEAIQAKKYLKTSCELYKASWSLSEQVKFSKIS